MRGSPILTLPPHPSRHIMHKQRTISFVSSVYLYYPDAAKLGRIVLNPQEPLETYLDLYPEQDKLKEIHESPGIDLSCTYNATKKKSLKGALLQLFSGLLSSSTEGEASLEGETKRYHLGNAEIHFRQACKGEDVREWLQENVVKPKVDAYMIVGYHTITNPKFVRGNKLARETKFGADDALVTSAAVPGHPGVANVRNSTWNHRHFQQRLSADGVGVFAVQYRKVVYRVERWYAESQAGLKDSKWYMFLDVRGQDDQGHYTVDADLGEVAGYEPEPEDSDDEDEVPVEPPESYFVEASAGGEDGDNIEEEFIFFHDMPPSGEENEE
ncbi:hypothetical protein BGX38DRAFT_684533 [Terfezia claveryi]|nr:hypothetical protein BGX38DRAFT_684533 [Terfezia claveryi]